MAESILADEEIIGQEIISHSQTLIKVYVLGDDVQLIFRDSIPYIESD